MVDRRICVLVFAGWFILLMPLAWSEDRDSWDPKKWEIGIWGGAGKVANDHGRDTKLMLAGIGVGKVVAGGSGGMALEYAMEFAPVFVIYQKTAVYGAEVAPLLLKLQFAPAARTNPFLEFGGGLLFTNSDVPENTSQFNFTPQLRFGVELARPHGQAFALAFQYVHISNANTAKRNRGYNSLHMQLGYFWSR